jgi:glutamine synthetase
MTKAHSIISNNETSSVKNASRKGIASYFGQMVFGPKSQKQYLSQKYQKTIEEAISKGHAISRDMAHGIAEGMKNWALDRGATHYTHWFQPLRQASAEKHDSFFQPTDLDTGIESFCGNALTQQEPDASSFPNGGIRNTFEARGYTVWDPSSPAFIIENAGTRTLCIPTIFVSYTGESLDYKAPLLKTLAFIRKAATDICKYFDKNVTDCFVSLGIEQEYFLVKEELFKMRPDLMHTGRTMIGRATAKGQELEDHYFGSIPTDVQAFMAEFEEKAHLLGIPLRTRHNEVAPGQFECTPQFELLNLAIDHNTLLMALMDMTAKNHGLKVLFHEKPFKGINGSGKHNNWSIITDTKVNLLSPGHTPRENLQFLTFFINIIKAIHDRDDLMRASIATAGNDYRLGANEAPPAIISVFVGHALEHVLDDFEKDQVSINASTIVRDSVEIPHIPEILFDNTDRNRTSPFAFTGNKFEFRSVGSSDNCANPMIVLNTIVADQLVKFKAQVEEQLKVSKDVPKEEVIKQILRKELASCRRILFGGNGYSQEWVEEAKRRGLKNIPTTAEAISYYLSPASVDVFVKNKIFSLRELEARLQVCYESFNLKMEIECRVLDEMVKNFVIPAGIRYQKLIAENVKTLLDIGQSRDSLKAQLSIIEELSVYINKIYENCQQMNIEHSKANNIKDAKGKAYAYDKNVKGIFDEIRDSADEIERIVDESEWKIPKYRKLLSLS